MRYQLTAERLKELVTYNPRTGLMERKYTRGRRIQKKHGNGRYKRMYVEGYEYVQHVLIWLYMTGKFPDGEVDHIDRDKCNNRWSNLRDVAPRENRTNTDIRVNNTTGATGVYRGYLGVSGQARWFVQVNGKHIGCFYNFDKAVEARKQAALAAGHLLPS